MRDGRRWLCPAPGLPPPRSSNPALSKRYQISLLWFVVVVVTSLANFLTLANVKELHAQDATYFKILFEKEGGRRTEQKDEQNYTVLELQTQFEDERKTIVSTLSQLWHDLFKLPLTIGYYNKVN